MKNGRTRKRKSRGDRTRYCLPTMVQEGVQLPGKKNKERITDGLKKSTAEKRQERPCCVSLTSETGLRGYRYRMRLR